VKLAANLSWLFTNLPLLDRPAAAARAGFDGVEVLFPYDTAPDDLWQSVETAGLTLELINTPNCATKGRAALANDVKAFRSDFSQAATYAMASGAPKLHVMSGTTDAPNARATLIDNLRWATAEAPDLTLTIEPLNPRDMPGYFLNDYYQAAEIIAQVAAPNLKLQFDTYHAQMIHGDAAETWRAVGQLDGHVQIAAAPDRTTPDDTTLAILDVILTWGYDGTIAGEYDPGGPTENSLHWLTALRTRA